MKKYQIIVFLMAAAAMTASCSMAEYGSFPGDYAMDGFILAEDEPDQEPGDKFDEIKENDFIKVSDQPVSTFSVDADGAAYAYMRRCVNNGVMPTRNSVRVEEYLNYFTFDYADPTGNETVAINAEVGDCPWNREHKLLRLGLKGKSLKDSEIPNANYTLLIDTSGSMNGSDRIDLIKTGLCTMIDYMKPTDRIAIITYSGEVKRLLESTLVKDASKIKKAIKKLEDSGGTAGGPAMKMAYEEATKHYVNGGNNRIIMCTDGDFNVGVSNTEALVEMVESYLDKGIYLSIMGFGAGNFQDSRMESLSNHGNGTYTYVDCEEEMMKVFVAERSHFYSVANDTKCQITFKGETVDSYRLIGYENRVMNNEDFENDKKDAGEIGAGQTITALYEIVPAEGFKKDANLARFDVRYKLALGGESRPLGLDISVPALDDKGSISAEDSENFRFAAGVATYALCLRGSEYAADANPQMALELVNSSLGKDEGGFRKQFAKLIEKAYKL